MDYYPDYCVDWIDIGGVHLEAETYARMDGSDLISCAWAPTLPGLHTIHVIVDPHDVLDDIDEINNFVIRNIEVGDTGRNSDPDPGVKMLGNAEQLG